MGIFRLFRVVRLLRLVRVIRELRLLVNAFVMPTARSPRRFENIDGGRDKESVNF